MICLVSQLKLVALPGTDDTRFHLDKVTTLHILAAADCVILQRPYDGTEVAFQAVGEGSPAVQSLDDLDMLLKATRPDCRVLLIGTKFDNLETRHIVNSADEYRDAVKTSIHKVRRIVLPSLSSRTCSIEFMLCIV